MSCFDKLSKKENALRPPLIRAVGIVSNTIKRIVLATLQTAGKPFNLVSGISFWVYLCKS